MFHLYKERLRVLPFHLFRERHRTSYRYASTSNALQREVSNIAVLGGGITGLATTYFLSRSLPSARITLFEASSRLGGWVHSTLVDAGGGKVVFEQGPRNLRPSTPNGLLTLQLVQELQLESRLLWTPKKSPSAQNRFVYYPDHLVRMPGPGVPLWSNIYNMLSEPVFHGTLAGMFSEVLRPRRPTEVNDQSIGSFLERRFGRPLVDKLASAIIHGIYAGDIYKLSARTILPQQWQFEERHASVIAGMLLGEEVPFLASDLPMVRELKQNRKFEGLLEHVKQSSVFTLKGGLGSLTNRLEHLLARVPNIKIRKNTQITNIGTSSSDSSICLTDVTNGTSEAFSHVISTIPARKLAEIVTSHETDVAVQETYDRIDLAPILRAIPAVTVMVVNLFFLNESLLPSRGFGYLIPRSIPFEQNPERALGVVFDSDVTKCQDDISGTKVTVMLGGHWWDEFDNYPDADEGAAMAKAVLQRHVGVSAEPEAIRVSLQRECIPQYEVGHEMRMRAAHVALGKWHGRLRVAGNSYTGVGLNDCIRAAHDVVHGLVEGSGSTGLDDFANGRQWTWVRASELKI